MTISLGSRKLHTVPETNNEVFQRFVSESVAAASYGGKADGLRGIRTGRYPSDKTPLIKGIHWHNVGRLVRYDLTWFQLWLTESREVHQRRINEYLNGSATPIEGVRAPGRPRREGSAR
jgi:hypothetical protein